MKYCCYLIVFFLNVSQLSFAAVGDSNIVISGSRDEYEFVWKKDEVRVKQSLTQLYFTNSYGTKVPVREQYDNQTTIDEVIFSADGKEPNIKPRYSYLDLEGFYYSDVRLCSFELPLQHKGSSGSVTFKKTISDPRYFCNIYFSDVYQVMHKDISIKIPRWMKVELKEMNFEGYQIHKTTAYSADEDADTYTYSINNLSSPGREPNSPGPSYILPHILVLCREANFSGNKRTYFNTLADQYAWYHQLVENTDNNKEGIRAKALEITTGLTNDLDKIKAILYWVQGNIRYMAFENGIAGFKPDKADEVIRKKYGDCKGMANTVKELLRSLGFDARLCWIGTNDIAYDYSTPSFAVDNHMICALNFEGKRYFLDGTETYLAFNDYGERIQGRQCLVEDGNNFLLANIPVTTFSQNLDQEKRVMEIVGTDLKGTSTRTWKGEEKQYILSAWNNTKKENTLRSFENYISKGNKNYVIADFKTSDINNIDSTLTASYNIDHKNAVSSFSNVYYVDLDFDKSLIDAFIDTSQRRTDYWFPFKMNLSKETELLLPAGYQPTGLPANLQIQKNNYEFILSYDVVGQKIIYKKSIIIKNTRLTKKMFSEWNKDIARLMAFYNEQIVLTAK